MRRTLAALITVATVAAADERSIMLGEKVRLPQSAAARLRVRGSQVTLTYDGLVEPVPCASKTNCGAGYAPARPHFTVDACDVGKGCAVIVGDVEWPTTDGQVGFVVQAATPARFAAALAACRRAPRLDWAQPDCSYLSDVMAFGQATPAQLESIRALSNPPQLKVDDRATLERQCADGRAPSCVALARQLRAADLEAAISLATRACRLGFPAGCRDAIAFLGNETSTAPARVMAVIELGCDQRIPGFCEDLVRRLKNGIGVKADPELASGIEAVFRTKKGPIRQQLEKP